ncbi:MAG: GIY-YIG nuclease family protein [Candidatus Marinimicrobia bacterium]|nr:GIY-YIG nuclease family protein [Candidatus Neomarinimicrobiota bacterium]
MKYYTYILQSKKDNRYYIGSTSDMERRLKEHNSGKTKSLRFRRPLVLIHKEEFDSRESAETREKQIKSYKGGIAFKKLISGSSSRQ